MKILLLPFLWLWAIAEVETTSRLSLWRGSLLPLGCEAAPNPETVVCQMKRVTGFATAAQPSGSKLPRHK
ncbi:hypothetical protein EAH78_09475 [Pseudomonas arsenicoxydans]|uniref:Uncharacterized protein n=1 Tax=Pseudomonas arsenicoxydans TaxID=702115 RepID=A0A502I0K4_9PSED|nr:hypothetical protein EAH78_09475 [Pseudomonas arsenicoxydans]